MRMLHGVGLLVALAAVVGGVATFGGLRRSPTVEALASSTLSVEEPRPAQPALAPALAGAGDRWARQGAPAVARIDGVVRIGTKPVAATIQAGREVPKAGTDGETLFETVARTTSGEDGAFALDLPAYGAIWIFGETETARGATCLWVSPEASRLRADLVLVEGRERLAGVAVDGEGRPWRGVVRARASGSSLPTGALPAATTDGDGNFRFEGLPAGPHQVGAELGGGAWVFGATVPLPTTAPYRLVAAFVGRTVTMRTVDAATGVGIAGVRVTVTASNPISRGSVASWDLVSHESVRTSEDGAARCVVPVAETVNVSGACDGWVGDSTSLPAGAAVCTLRLIRGGVLEGTVVRADTGVPVEGIEVSLDGSSSVPSPVTDEKGTFRFTGIGPTHRGNTHFLTSLRVRGRGLFIEPTKDSQDGVNVEVRSGETTTVTIRVAPGRSITGSVRRANGEPAGDAEVWVASTGWTSGSAALGRARTRTDAGGVFRIEGVPLAAKTSELVVFARAADTGTAVCELEPFVLEFAPTRPPRRASDPVDLVLPSAGRLELTVIDADTRQPISGARVSLAFRGAAEFSGVTDASGRLLATGLTPGSVSVAVTEPLGVDYTTDSGVIAVDVPVEGTGTATVTVSFIRRCTIRGTLVYADGSPVRHESFGLCFRTVDGAFAMATDARGSFERTLRWSSYDVFVTRGDMHRARAIDANDPSVLAHERLSPNGSEAVLRLSLPPPIPLEIRAVDETGAPIVSGTVRAYAATEHEENESSLWAREAARIHDGRASVDGTRMPVWLEVIPDRAGDASWARTRIGPFAPGTPSVEVRVARGRSISGTVRGPDGVGVAGASVTLDSLADVEPESWRDHDYDATATSADGAFRFDGLPAGTYRLFTRVAPPLAAPESIDVVAGRADVVISVASLVDVDVRVIASGGGPAAATTVLAFEAPWFRDQGAKRETTDATGVARLKGLDPAQTYVLEVREGLEWNGIVRARRAGWTPAPTTIRLATLASLSIRVVDADGRPAPNATATLRYLDHPEAPPTVLYGHLAAHGDDGSFTGVRTVDGAVAIVAVDGYAMSRTRIVREGADAVVLEIPKRDGRVRVEMVDWPDTPPNYEGGPSSEYCLWDQADVGVRLYGWPTPDGVVAIEGLASDRVYDLFVRNRVHPEFMALVTGLRADGVTRRVERQPAVALEGHVAAPQGAYVSDISIVELGDSVRIAEGGRFQIGWLPKGTWTIRATGLRSRTEICAQVRTDGPRVPDLVLPSR